MAPKTKQSSRLSDDAITRESDVECGANRRRAGVAGPRSSELPSWPDSQRSRYRKACKDERYDHHGHHPLEIERIPDMGQSLSDLSWGVQESVDRFVEWIEFLKTASRAKQRMQRSSSVRRGFMSHPSFSIL